MKKALFTIDAIMHLKTVVLLQNGCVKFHVKYRVFIDDN